MSQRSLRESFARAASAESIYPDPGGASSCFQSVLKCNLKPVWFRYGLLPHVEGLVIAMRAPRAVRYGASAGPRNALHIKGVLPPGVGLPSEAQITVVALEYTLQIEEDPIASQPRVDGAGTGSHVFPMRYREDDGIVIRPLRR